MRSRGGAVERLDRDIAGTRGEDPVLEAGVGRFPVGEGYREGGSVVQEAVVGEEEHGAGQRAAAVVAHVGLDRQGGGEFPGLSIGHTRDDRLSTLGADGPKRERSRGCQVIESVRHRGDDRRDHHLCGVGDEGPRAAVPLLGRREPVVVHLPHGSGFRSAGQDGVGGRPGLVLDRHRDGEADLLARRDDDVALRGGVQRAQVVPLALGAAGEGDVRGLQGDRAAREVHGLDPEPRGVAPVGERQCGGDALADLEVREDDGLAGRQLERRSRRAVDAEPEGPEVGDGGHLEGQVGRAVRQRHGDPVARRRPLDPDGRPFERRRVEAHGHLGEVQPAGSLGHDREFWGVAAGGDRSRLQGRQRLRTPDQAAERQGHKTDGENLPKGTHLVLHHHPFGLIGHLCRGPEPPSVAITPGGVDYNVFKLSKTTAKA